MSDSSTLRQKAREAIQTGRLPKRPPEHVWGGAGAGACCAICGKLTTPDEIEFELDFIQPGETPGATTYFAHGPCFSAWKLEMRTSMIDGPGNSNAVIAAARNALPTTIPDGTIDVCERIVTQEREPG
jgi:hypothetical protein